MTPRLVVIGAAGSQCQDMLARLERAMRMDGVLAVDVVWPGDAEARVQALGATTATGDLLSGSDDLADRSAGADLVVNLAGPGYRIGAAGLRLALTLGADYMDICDDADAAEQMLALDEEAKRAGTAALTGMGNGPGVTNVLMRLGLDALPDRGNGASIRLLWTADGADTTPAILDHLMHCFSTALPGRDRTPEWPELEPERVNFGEPVGVQEVVRLGHPEPLTIPRFTNAASVVNKGGVAPSEQLHISWVAARLRDDGVDDGALTAVFRAAELGVERRERIGTALRIDVELDGEGVRFAGSSTIRMTHATGVSAAAGVLLMLEKPFDAPGVYAPECLDPAAVFGKLRLVSAGGGGVTGMRLRSGEPVEPLRIRDLLAARVQ